MRPRHKPRVFDEDTSVAHLTIDRRDRELSDIIEDNLEFGVQLLRNEVVVTTQREEIEMRGCVREVLANFFAVELEQLL
jgi:hypothetical protein